MRFFSHEWAASDDNALTRHVAREYGEMLREYPLPARSSVRRFVESFDLRGALLDGLSIDSGSRTVSMNIFTGDRRSGYKLLKIVYTDASIPGDGRKAFDRVVAEGSPQIRYDEFDFVVSPGSSKSCRHRYLFWPKEYGEGEIAFQDLGWTLERAEERPRRGLSG